MRALSQFFRVAPMNGTWRKSPYEVVPSQPVFCSACSGLSDRCRSVADSVKRSVRIFGRWGKSMPAGHYRVARIDDKDQAVWRVLNDHGAFDSADKLCRIAKQDTSAQLSFLVGRRPLFPGPDLGLRTCR